jgi:hypothetical protein
MTQHDHINSHVHNAHEAEAEVPRAARFSLSQHGVGPRLALAGVLVVLIWAAILMLVK